MSSYEGKPRFPLSVERQFTFRAVVSDCGCIIESPDFKTLYRAVRRHLRADVFQINPCGEYRSYRARLQFGFSTVYEIRKGYYYSEWTTVKDYGSLRVSNVSEWWYDEDSDKVTFIRGRYNN